jgi:tetratricopeptide (TPR) repeat protein
MAALLAGTAFISLASAHEDGAEKRGKELFQQGRAYAESTKAEDDRARPALYDGIGTFRISVTTKSREAETYFKQGWALAWNFNHAEARRAFKEAQRLDPSFAMAHWGEALVLGSNINDPMRAEAVVPAYEAITRAMALKAGVSEIEGALIEALARRYGANPMANRSALDHDWARAMSEVVKRFPDDANAHVLYADALMNLQPWDYWERDGATPKKNAAAIVSALERAFAIDPNHWGAAHLYIHAVEASSTPERAEPAADRLRGATPALGHLLHMPSHLYTRLGRHKDAMEANREAIAADEAFIRTAGSNVSALYRFGYYPHNAHFLMISAQMAGVADAVFSAAEKLSAITSDKVSQQLAWVQAIKTANYSAHAQFADQGTIMALAGPGDEFPFVKGFWHYARATALAAGKDVSAAEAEKKAIADLIAKADFSNLEAQYLPARTVLTIAEHVVAARIAQARADYQTAETHLRKAAELEATLPYMEPPYWYYPVRQTLAAVLLQQGRAAEAAAEFKEALKERPRNSWALWGLMQAQMALKDRELATTREAFEKAWLGDKTLLSMERL